MAQRADLAHLEKVAAVREKTMRVAHDIRNTLTTIQAVCGTLIMETQNTQQRERLRLISSQVDQLAAILVGNLDRTADLDDPPTLVDVGSVVRSLVNLLQYQANRALDFQLQLHSSRASYRFKSTTKRCISTTRSDLDTARPV